MCAFAFGMNAVDGNGALDPAVSPGSPKTIAVFVISFEKFGKLTRDFSFEEESESPVFVVVNAVKLCNASQGPRDIPLFYLDRSHENLRLNRGACPPDRWTVSDHLKKIIMC
jgi:hypothetical protein